MACVSPAPSLNAMPGWRCSHDAVEQCPTALSKTRGFSGFLALFISICIQIGLSEFNIQIAGNYFVYIQFYEQTHLREQMAKKGLPYLETKVVVKEYTIY